MLFHPYVAPTTDTPYADLALDLPTPDIPT